MARFGTVDAHLHCLDAHARECGGDLCRDERSVGKYLDTESVFPGRLDERKEVLAEEGLTPGEVDASP
jgi:hypothetical protein